MDFVCDVHQTRKANLINSLIKLRPQFRFEPKLTQLLSGHVRLREQEREREQKKEQEREIYDDILPPQINKSRLNRGPIKIIWKIYLTLFDEDKKAILAIFMLLASFYILVKDINLMK